MSTAGDDDPPFAAIHPDLIQSHILNRLDGTTLASASCASAQFLSLCNDNSLWQQLCHSTWPSTAHPRVSAAISSHRSFFSDSFPARRHSATPPPPSPSPQTSELISAVDIYFDGQIIYSKVLVTDALSTWFLCTPLRLDILDPKETITVNVPASLERAADLFRVSWILIDPARQRSINVASERAVDVRCHWLMDNIQLRFATTIAGRGGEPLQCGVVITCGGGRVKEVSMQVEEMEGKIVTGKEALWALQATMEAPKSKREWEREKEIHEAFVKMKRQYKERKQKREKGLDLACIAVGVSIFLAMLFWITCLWRR